MKQLLIIAFLPLSLTFSYAAGIPVVDGPAATQRERLHAEQIAQLKVIGQNQRDQLSTLNQQLDELLRLNQSVGDPALVTALPGVEALAASASSDASAAPLNVSFALGDSGGGVFTVIGDRFTTLDGTTVARGEEGYRPVAAVVAGRAQLEAVFAAVNQRREQLRQASRETLEQLRAATTDAEVQKLQGVFAALHLELDATDRDLQFAAQRLQVQALDNQNDRERQSLARQEEQATEIRLALKRMTETLRPNTQPTSLRVNR